MRNVLESVVGLGGLPLLLTRVHSASVSNISRMKDNKSIDSGESGSAEGCSIVKILQEEMINKYNLDLQCVI